MIRILVGDNDFEKQRALERIINASDSTVEKYDGNNLEINDLPDLLRGATLFAASRLVVINNLSANSSAWEGLADMLDSISDSTELVLIETKLDKRLSTYKKIVELSDIKEFNDWDDRDTGNAIKWLIEEAKAMKLELDTKLAQQIVNRVGVNQVNIYRALEKLSLVDEISFDVIEDIIDASPTENVFSLLEIAIAGDGSKISKVIKNLELTEDPVRLLALMSGQAFQLAVIINSSSENNIASDFGVHPYVVTKLKNLAKGLKKSDAKKIVNIFAEADDDIKISKGDPWMIIEIALQRVAAL